MSRPIHIAGFLFLVLGLIPYQINAHAAEEGPGRSLPVYHLTVSFDLANGLVRGDASITAPEGGKTTVTRGKLRITSVTLNGSPLPYGDKDSVFTIRAGETLGIQYEAVFTGDGGSLDNPGVVQGGLVSDKGISLTGNWYPAIGGLAYYKLTALVPDHFIALSEADEIAARETASGKEYSFIFSHPLSGVDFVAGNYREFRDSVDDIAVYAYFFPDDASLAAEYISHTKKYLKMYKELLVPYPYKRFSVVENILPTGESMPTFTLLGQEIIRLPFIPETSLGHEITHQWFGNYVYADFNKGNWLEAITSYLSDHLYKELEGRGWEYRKNIMIEFQSYVHPGNDFPLRKFMERIDRASMAIGYGKGAMLFHMLDTMVGQETFLKSARRLIRGHEYQQASWEDIEKAFEQESGKDLGRFFKEWLDRKGVPTWETRYPGARILQGRPAAVFELLQKGEPYKFELPVKAKDETAVEKHTFVIDKERQYLTLTLKEVPSALILDEDYNVMRTLASEEFAPVIARLLGDEKKLLVYPEKEKGKYAGLIGIFEREGFIAKEQDQVNDGELQHSSLLILGADSPVWKRLFGEPAEKRPGFYLFGRSNPLNSAKVAFSAHADSKEEADLAVEKIFHYGTYSTLHFRKGNNVAKEIAEADRGMIFDISEPVTGVEPKKAAPLAGIIDAVSESPIILIGERHTNYEDHKVELSVIMGLYKKGRKFAIGMEMFQKPFQNVVNNYLAGSIDEREFLRKTEYFKRWVFDYNLYREIIEFARAKGIPIVALNQRTEIMDKVAKGGLDALSPDERKEIPQDMNMADESYRERLQDVYEDHPAGTTFENFYQSQILWDETMAHSAAGFLVERPEYQLVVLAGVEHVMYGSGIPSRLRRLAGKEYSTLINGSFDSGIGTYVLFPEPLEPPFTPTLGVIAKESGGRVSIASFPDESAAFAAGLKEGDIITFVNGWKIETVSDIKIALFGIEPGQAVSVKAVRKSFFLGSRELEFRLEL
jgi:aminopeptidase N